jgi:tRNA1Val (adenine37-N6)-methyltransferase
MPGLIRPARRPPGWVAPGPQPRGMGDDPALAPRDDEDLCYLAGDWRIFQKQKGHRWSLDDLVTAAVAAQHIEATDARHLLDLGCGLGSVLMLLAWRFPQATVTGVEAQADRAAMAKRSLRFNGADERCQIIDGDLREFTGPAVDFISGTPPYFPRGTGTESKLAHAMPCRFEVRGGVEAYLEAARSLLRPAGRVVLCSAMLEADRVERGARETGFHVIEHVEIIPRIGKAALIAVDVFSREAEPRLDRSLTVRDEQLQWTPAFQAVRSQFGMPTTR